MYADSPETTLAPLGAIGLVAFILFAAAFAGAFGLDERLEATAQNIPAAQLSEHAIEKHGSIALEALARWQNGACTEVYRRNDYKKWIRIVDADDPAMAFGIIQRASGNGVTAYLSLRAYWYGRVLFGYTFEGWEGTCAAGRRAGVGP